MSGPEIAARAWLAHATDDLEAARMVVSGHGPAGPAAYLCQQAAEKMLKACLVRHGVRPERTHDISRLAEAVVARAPDLRAAAAPLVHLTDWAVAPRYPDVMDAPPVEVEEVRALLPRLDILLARVTEVVRGLGGDGDPP